MTASKLTIGTHAPEEINVFIEIAQGSAIKYEMDKATGLLMVDRFLHTAMVYPFNYGFAPETLSEDGDALDVVVISAQPVIPGSIIPARPIGMLDMEDESGLDVKIIAVPTKNVDPWFTEIEQIDDLGQHQRKEIEHFFSHYKELEQGKWVKIRHFGTRKEALAVIEKSMKAAK